MLSRPFTKEVGSLTNTSQRFLHFTPTLGPRPKFKGLFPFVLILEGPKSRQQDPMSSAGRCKGALIKGFVGESRGYMAKKTSKKN